jgi:hypothetical protein
MNQFFFSVWRRNHNLKQTWWNWIWQAGMATMGTRATKELMQVAHDVVVRPKGISVDRSSSAACEQKFQCVTISWWVASIFSCWFPHLVPRSNFFFGCCWLSHLALPAMTLTCISRGVHPVLALMDHRSSPNGHLPCLVIIRPMKTTVEDKATLGNVLATI